MPPNDVTSPDLFPRPMQRQDSHFGHHVPASMGGHPATDETDVVPRGEPFDRKGEAAHRLRTDRIEKGLPINGSGVVPASGTLIIGLGGPADGYVWDIRQLLVGPADLTALPYATGVTVLVGCRAVVSGPGADNSANAILSTTTSWPAEATWGRREFVVEAGENVVVIVIGLVAGTNVTAAGSVEQTAQAAEEIKGR